MTDRQIRGLLQRLATHARRVIHFDQIAAYEIETGAPARYVDCKAAENCLAQACIEAEELLGLKPDKRKYPMLVGTRKGNLK